MYKLLPALWEADNGGGADAGGHILYPAWDHKASLVPARGSRISPTFTTSLCGHLPKATPHGHTRTFWLPVT